MSKMRYFKWIAIAIAILLGAWFLSTLLEVVGDQRDARQDRLELAQQVAELDASREELHETVNELNHRCLQAKDCTPVPVPESPPNTVELQDIEVQEREIQQPERDDPEIQNPENQQDEEQEGENQEAEEQEAEEQEGEIQDEEIQEEEIQEEEIQEEEKQEAEIDNPDPASPFTFTFTFFVPGTIPTDPGRSYTVTCNSGTGNCTVS